MQGVLDTVRMEDVSSITIELSGYVLFLKLFKADWALVLDSIIVTVAGRIIPYFLEIVSA